MAKRLIKNLAKLKPIKLLTGLFLFAAIIGVIFISAESFNTNVRITDQPATKTEPLVPKVSLESVFNKPNNLSDFDKNSVITLVATGDVIPARGANWPAVTGNDFTFNWKKTSTLLKSADITLINLEAPLMKDCQLMTEGMTFCGDTRQVQGFVSAGVDSVSLANNHIANFGQEGIDETINLLEKNKIGWSGFGHLDTHKIKGIKFGFLAYNGIETTFDKEAIRSEIKKAKGEVDVLIVSAHWGKEYEPFPQTSGNVAPDNPIEIGHLMIDSEADLIIGNHPHTVQGVEIYKNKFITYAHGNFIFDQTWSQETQEGVVGEYTFYEKQLVNVKFHPISYDTHYQPKFLSKKDGQHILDRMKKSSLEISSVN